MCDVEQAIDWIRQYADDQKRAARQVQAWSLDELRVVAGDAVLVPTKTAGARLMLCHRPCTEYAHFHTVLDATDWRICRGCRHTSSEHLFESGQCVPGAPCDCAAFVPAPEDAAAVRKTRPHPDSPGYWNEDGWVATGCRKHDLDPCGVCDVE